MRGAEVDMKDLTDAGGAVGLFAGVVTIWHMLTGRNEKRIREIADRRFREIEEEKRIEIRINTLEVTLPMIARDVSDTKIAVGTLNEKLDDLLLSGRLPIKKSE